MKHLGATLLGALDLRLDGESIEHIDSDKTRALLVYLLLEADRVHRRDYLAELFWPGKPEEVGRNSLKQALANLRKALKDTDTNSFFLLVSREEINFNSGSDHWVDVEEFDELLKQVRDHNHENLETCRACSHWLNQAVGLYRGDFLEQFHLADCSAFEEWILIRKERYQRQVAEALRNLVCIHESVQDFIRATEYARKLVAHEPWDEGNQRCLMRLLALNNMRSAALKQYHLCRKILIDELGVEPSEETNALYEQIKERKLAAPERLEELVQRAPIQPPQRKSAVHWLLFVAGLAVILLAVKALFPLADAPADASLPEEALETGYAIYIDGLSTGWSLDPYGGTGILDSSTMPHAGTQSIEVTIQPDLWITFDAYPPIDGVAYTHLVFFINGGESADQRLYVEMKSVANILVGQRVYLSDPGILKGGSLQAGEWQFVSIPLALLDPEGKPFAWFDIGDASGKGASTFFLDDISLMNWSGPLPDESISREEQAILTTLYNQAYGPGWVNSSGWLSDNSPCTWYGVTCKDGAVSQLRLSNSNLSGRIPQELGGLDELEVLQLSNNHFSGPVPASLGDLMNLNHLYLSDNLLSGTIPDNLGNLANLESLDLSSNQFSGAIPAEFGRLSNLRYLALFGNSQLGGQIPPELGNLANLEILLLSNYQERTQLSGPIPGELGNLNNLKMLQLSNSEVDGPIPPELGNLNNLVILDVGSNALSGSLPSELGNLAQLKTLVVGGNSNELAGSLPLSLMNLRDLYYFNYAGATGLCEPQTAEFQAWMESIPVLDGSRIYCSLE